MPVSAQQRVTARFERYLLQERKLSQGTAAYYVRFAHRYLCERFKQGVVNLACIRAADVTGFIQHRAHHGLRLGEALNLRIQDIDWAEGMLAVRNTKFEGLG